MERSIGSVFPEEERVGLVRWRRVLAWDCGVKVGERRVGRERWDEIWSVEGMGRAVGWGGCWGVDMLVVTLVGLWDLERVVGLLVVLKMYSSWDEQLG